jgi:hypothetical protein
MAIRKVNMDELFPPKVEKTYSEAVYVGEEDLVPVPMTLPAIDGQVIHDKLKAMVKGEPTYFPEYRLKMVPTGINTPYRQPAQHIKGKYQSAIRNRAMAMGLKVSIHWVKSKNNTVTMRVTLK